MLGMLCPKVHHNHFLSPVSINNSNLYTIYKKSRLLVQMCKMKNVQLENNKNYKVQGSQSTSHILYLLLLALLPVLYWVWRGLFRMDGTLVSVLLFTTTSIVASLQPTMQPAFLNSLFSLLVLLARILLPQHRASALATTDWWKISKVLLHRPKDLSFLRK